MGDGVSDDVGVWDLSDDTHALVVEEVQVEVDI